MQVKHTVLRKNTCTGRLTYYNLIINTAQFDSPKKQNRTLQQCRNNYNKKNENINDNSNNTGNSIMESGNNAPQCVDVAERLSACSYRWTAVRSTWLNESVSTFVASPATAALGEHPSQHISVSPTTITTVHSYCCI